METHPVRYTSIVFLLVFCLVLTSCVDGTWLKLVGRWQDVEFPGFEIEFTQSGLYREFLYDQQVGHGKFHAEGSNITLNYGSPCGAGTQVDCTVRLRFRLSGDILILTDSFGDILYRRSD